MSSSEEVLVGQVPKNATEVYKITTTKYQGHDLVNLRVWFRGSDGNMRPGKQGISVRPARIAEIIEFLDKAASPLIENKAEFRQPYAD